jgi:cytochrome c peroxidase
MNNKLNQFRSRCVVAVGLLALTLTACVTKPPPEPPTLVALGEQLFLNETFNGNGRTCGTCHRPTDNFGLTPAFIATLLDDDPLFVAEKTPI